MIWKPYQRREYEWRFDLNKSSLHCLNKISPKVPLFNYSVYLNVHAEKNMITEQIFQSIVITINFTDAWYNSLKVFKMAFLTHIRSNSVYTLLNPKFTDLISCHRWAIGDFMQTHLSFSFQKRNLVFVSFLNERISYPLTNKYRYACNAQLIKNSR